MAQTNTIRIPQTETQGLPLQSPAARIEGVSPARGVQPQEMAAARQQQATDRALGTVRDGRKVLDVNSSGPEVVAVKELLNQLRGSKLDLRNNNLGPETQGELRAFQRRNDLPVTGKVDKATLAVLEHPEKHVPAPAVSVPQSVVAAALPQIMKVITGERMISPGEQGEHVKLVQMWLNRVSPPLPMRVAENGDFGPSTVRALLKFKGQHSLGIDPKVDNRTLAELQASMPMGLTSADRHRVPLPDLVALREVRANRPEAMLKDGMQGEEVKALQRLLNTIKPGSVSEVGKEDGNFGPTTSNALISFLKSEHKIGNVDVFSFSDLQGFRGVGCDTSSLLIRRALEVQSQKLKSVPTR